MSPARMAVCALLLGFGCLWSLASLAARESNGTPAAKALSAQGEAAAKAGRLADAAAAFRRAIDADPDFVDAHQRFIEITQRQELPASRTPAVPRLQKLYERWARQYPNRAAYQWALGFLSPEADTADVFFKKALALDPAFARAHLLLAKNADQQYGVQGTPETALIDPHGRIMFRPYVHDAATRAVLEREIDALLNRAAER